MAFSAESYSKGLLRARCPFTDRPRFLERRLWPLAERHAESKPARPFFRSKRKSERRAVAGLRALAARTGQVHPLAMEWAGDGLVLAMRPHGENSAILEIFSAEHGRHTGVVRGGTGRKLGPHLQPGNELSLRWRARLEGQLGQFSVEPLRARAGRLMQDRLSLAALSSVCALLSRALPEREPHPALHAATLALLDAVETLPDWRLPYLKWELGLLSEIGYGLDLTQCAVTGARQGLAFVSPKTGRAVTHEGAGDWADRLLPLPACLTSTALIAPALDEMGEALSLTGHFLTRGLAGAEGQIPLPEARNRLSDLLSRLKPGERAA